MTSSRPAVVVRPADVATARAYTDESSRWSRTSCRARARRSRSPPTGPGCGSSGRRRRRCRPRPRR